MAQQQSNAGRQSNTQLPTGSNINQQVENQMSEHPANADRSRAVTFQEEQHSDSLGSLLAQLRQAEAEGDTPNASASTGVDTQQSVPTRVEIHQSVPPNAIVPVSTRVETQQSVPVNAIIPVSSTQQRSESENTIASLVAQMQQLSVDESEIQQTPSSSALVPMDTAQQPATQPDTQSAWI